jgi:hypothetical protein
VGEVVGRGGRSRRPRWEKRGAKWEREITPSTAGDDIRHLGQRFLPLRPAISPTWTGDLPHFG